MVKEVKWTKYLWLSLLSFGAFMLEFLSQKGILTEKRFLKLTDTMEKEQESNQNRMQEIAALISEEEHSEGDVRTFMEEIKRYATLRNLTKQC